MINPEERLILIFQYLLWPKLILWGTVIQNIEKLSGLYASNIMQTHNRILCLNYVYVYTNYFDRKIFPRNFTYTYKYYYKYFSYFWWLRCLKYFRDVPTIITKGSKQNFDFERKSSAGEEQNGRTEPTFHGKSIIKEEKKSIFNAVMMITWNSFYLRFDQMQLKILQLHKLTPEGLVIGEIKRKIFSSFKSGFSDSAQNTI